LDDQTTRSTAKNRLTIADLAKCDHALTCAEVARLLNLHQLTVYKLARTNRLPGAFRIGSAVRFSPHRLAEYLAEQGAR